MVNFKLAVAFLVLHDATGFYSSNQIGMRRKRWLVGSTNIKAEKDPRSNGVARFVSYSVDGMNYPLGKDETNDWMETTKSLLDGDAQENMAEGAAEQELDLRRQQLRDRGAGNGTPYTVELPLYSGIGITLGQISPGRIFSTYELDLDTLKLNLTPTTAEAAAEDSDTRQQRERLNCASPDYQARLDSRLSGLVVTSVIRDSSSWNAGIRPGDLLSAVSATIGDSLWPKSSLEGVQSAISSRRNIVGAQTIKMQLKTLAATPVVETQSQYELTLTRPLGFNIRESTDGSGYVEVASISDKASNLVKHAIQVGDRIVAIGSSLGGQLWPASSTVEGVISACTGRLPGQPVTIRFNRPVVNLAKEETRDASAMMGSTVVDTRFATSSVTTTPTIAKAALVKEPVNVEELRSRCRNVLKRYTADDSLFNQQQQRQARSVEGFPALVADKVVDALASASAEIDCYTLHMIMNAYLLGGKAAKAIKVFEASTGFAADGSITKEPAIIQGTKPSSSHGNRIIPTEGSLNLYTCTALLRAHSQLGDFASVRRVLSAMEGKSGETIGDGIEIAPWPWTGALGSLQPDTVCYNIAIAAAERVGGSEAITVAMELFGKMVPPTKKSPSTDRPLQNLVTFNTLISALSNDGRSKEAFGLFDRMQRLGLRPDKYTYTSLIKVCSDDGDLQELLYDMKARGVQPDVVTYNTMIKSLCEKREWTQATRLISEMESRGVSPDSRTYSLLMNEMLKEGKPTACLTLFETACASSRTSILTENVYLYTIAISAASKLGDHQRALELVGRMNAQGVKPNLMTLTAVMGACLASGKPDVAVQVFKRIEQPDGYATAQGIRAMCETGDLIEAAERIEQLKRGSQRLMTGKEIMQLYDHFFKASLQRGEYQLARTIFSDLMRKGDIPNKSIYQTFTDAFNLNPPLKRTSMEVKRTEEIDLPKFRFLLFVVDELQKRSLPVEGGIFTSTLILGNELAGLPRRLASLMSDVKSATQSGTKLFGTGTDDRQSTMANGWDDLLLTYDSIPKEKLIPEHLPPLVVRVAPRDVRRVLRAEVAVSYFRRNSSNGRLPPLKQQNRQQQQLQQ